LGKRIPQRDLVGVVVNSVCCEEEECEGEKQWSVLIILYVQLGSNTGGLHHFRDLVWRCGMKVFLRVGGEAKKAVAKSLDEPC